MSRLKITVKNTTAENIRCSDICGGEVDIFLNKEVKAGKQLDISSDSHDRIFLKFEGYYSGRVYPVAVTCPRSSHNSATGYGTSGLQPYNRRGNGVTFTFMVDRRDEADWDNGDSFHRVFVPYGEVS